LAVRTSRWWWKNFAADGSARSDAREAGFLFHAAATMTRVLVTGANGFLGSALVRALAARGDAVTALVRETSNCAALDGCPVARVTGDVQDKNSLARAIRGHDIVFHCAGRVADWGPRQEFFRVNVEGTGNLLEASRSAGIRHFVHISSLVVLGVPRSMPVNETAPYAARAFNPYIETKILAEKLVLEYYTKYRLPITIIRPGIIWGPGDTTIFPRLEQLARKRLLAIIGKGTNVLCLSYIGNLVAAMLQAAAVEQPDGQIYSIADEEQITSRTFFVALAEALGLPPPTRAVPFFALYAAAVLCELWARLARPAQAPLLTRLGLYLWGTHYIADTTRARQKLGFVPKVSFAAGMHNLASWYRQCAAAPEMGGLREF
jgi:nucleoside-diphosphate-sugar epimerase